MKTVLKVAIFIINHYDSRDLIKVFDFVDIYIISHGAGDRV